MERKHDIRKLRMKRMENWQTGLTFPNSGNCILHTIMLVHSIQITTEMLCLWKSSNKSSIVGNHCLKQKSVIQKITKISTYFYKLFAANESADYQKCLPITYSEHCILFWGLSKANINICGYLGLHNSWKIIHF